jgi:predicted amidohydrolase
MSRLLAACVQLNSRDDVARNLSTIARLCGEARERGAQLAVLPENFAFMGANEQDKFAHAESLDGERSSTGPILAALRETAAKTGLWIVGGGMPEKSAREGFVHNTAVVVAPDGKLAARYRKIHLFDIDIPGGAQFKESGTVAPGADVVTVDTPWAKLGLSICYDLRFPELYRALTGAGARLVVVPAAFTLHTGKDHWLPLLRARAIENQVYVLAAGQVGRTFGERACWGKSSIIDPWGALLAEAPDREGVIVAEIDLAWQDKVRRELPCLEHRRL